MTATPIGDSLRDRFGSRDTTHALGVPGDWAGCAAWHSLCAYEAGRAEALREFAQVLDEMTELARPGTAVRGSLVQIAKLARERSSASPGATEDARPVSLDAPEASGSPQGREDAIRYDERRRLLAASRSITVLMTRADGAKVAVVQWSALLKALGLKP